RPTRSTARPRTSTRGDSSTRRRGSPAPLEFRDEWVYHQVDAQTRRGHKSLEELHKIRIKKVLGPTQTGTAVLLGNETKTFVMFIGLYEGAAIIRELNGEVPARPLTHELLSYILDGFNIDVKKIVISDIINNTFCATLVLEQRVTAENEEWAGKRN